MADQMIPAANTRLGGRGRLGLGGGVPTKGLTILADRSRGRGYVGWEVEARGVLMVGRREGAAYSRTGYHTIVASLRVPLCDVLC